ncbi:MAG: hypothetical protein QGI08_10085 [Paracoccaceae bacterium]|jgi:HEPN domain-containing protein|nr:hypothetical protein [Paracoccaceae bacterium]MDP7186058.1 hypothetical protein [Paracoccaceae bacterium]
MSLTLQHFPLPTNFKFNQFVCFEFLLVGLDKIRAANQAKNSDDGAYIILAGGAVGMANAAQGLELLLKAILKAQKIKEPSRNHNLIEMYQRIASNEVLKANFQHLSQSLDLTATERELEEIVSAIHASFMPSRYLGLKKETISIPNADKATLLVIALIATFFGDFARDTVVRLGLSDATVQKIFGFHSP